MLRNPCLILASCCSLQERLLLLLEVQQVQGGREDRKVMAWLLLPNTLPLVECNSLW